mmetsp:Transcript_6930/g.23380  ORF Transcript_6930/g.23380 Transcript_6930/m.23380 type:complete len:254 (+) Transcript_6930:960-1721(+)
MAAAVVVTVERGGIPAVVERGGNEEQCCEQLAARCGKRGAHEAQTERPYEGLVGSNIESIGNNVHVHPRHVDAQGLEVVLEHERKHLSPQAGDEDDDEKARIVGDGGRLAEGVADDGLREEHDERARDEGEGQDTHGRVHPRVHGAKIAGAEALCGEGTLGCCGANKEAANQVEECTSEGARSKRLGADVPQEERVHEDQGEHERIARCDGYRQPQQLPGLVAPGHLASNNGALLGLHHPPPPRAPRPRGPRG